MVVVVVTKDASHLVDGGSGCDQASGRGGCDQAWPTWPTLTGLLSVHFENSTTSSHNYICPLISLNCLFVYLHLSIFVEFLEIVFPCVCSVLTGLVMGALHAQDIVWTHHRVCFKCLDFQMFEPTTTECVSNVWRWTHHRVWFKCLDPPQSVVQTFFHSNLSKELEYFLFNQFTIFSCIAEEEKKRCRVKFSEEQNTKTLCDLKDTFGKKIA